MLILSDVYRDARVARSARVAAERGRVIVLGIERRGASRTSGPLIDSPHCSVRVARIRSFALPAAPLRRAFGYVEVLFRLLWRAWRVRPDLVHAHEVWTLPVAIAIRLMRGVPFVYDAHELYRERDTVGPLLRRVIAGLEWAAFRLGGGVIACNHERASVMHAEYGCPRRPVVVANVWDPTTFDGCTEPVDLEGSSESLRDLVARHNPQIRRIALYQGSISEARDVLTVVRALALLPEECGLVLVGPWVDGFRVRLVHEAEIAGVVGRLVIRDAVHPTSLARMTREADVGIACYAPISRNNILCAPNKLSEYAIAGLPIVGTDQKAIREFVVEHGNGITYAPGDVAGCAEAMRLALVHEPTVAALHERARLAAARISWEPERRKLVSVYRRALKRAS